jgi:hypothetical protein
MILNNNLAIIANPSPQFHPTVTHICLASTLLVSTRRPGYSHKSAIAHFLKATTLLNIPFAIRPVK